MFGQSKTERIKKSAISASELAQRLAQDKRFRKKLLSAIEHGAAARRRTRRGLGFAAAVRRLAKDQALLAELSRSRDDLRQAYRRLEAKRRSHKLRNLTLVAGLASLAAVPQVRERIASLVAGIRSNQRVADVAARVGSKGSGQSSSQPRSLEDLSREELYARAQEADIPGRSEMSKEQLIDSLRAKS
jgi:hypothetical protein